MLKNHLDLKGIVSVSLKKLCIICFFVMKSQKQSYFVVLCSSNSLKMSVLLDMKFEKMCGVA